MSERKNDREELECLVDKLELENCNAGYVQSEIRLRETGVELKLPPDE
jgi:hypothetical protein